MEEYDSYFVEIFELNTVTGSLKSDQVEYVNYGVDVSYTPLPGVNNSHPDVLTLTVI